MDQRPLTPNEANDASVAAFHAKYMTTTDVCDFLGISRVSVHQARKNGRIPDGIPLNNHVTLWERALIMPHLQAWKEYIDARAVQRTLMQSTVVSETLAAAHA